MKKILTILILFISAYSYGQYKPMVGQFRSDTAGGERVEFLHSSPARKGQITDISTPAILSDSLSNYAKLLDSVNFESVNVTGDFYKNGVQISIGSPYTFTSPLSETSGTVSIDLLSIPITDSDIISALTGATYSNNRSTITPAGSKIMYAGQLYDDGTYTYIAISNNSIRRW